MIFKILTTLLLIFVLNSCSNSNNSDKNDNNKSTYKVENNRTIEEKKISIDKNSSNRLVLKKSILTIHTLNGEEIHVDEAKKGLTFKEYKNKTVFVIFFGYRCPPCLHEIPNLISLMAKKYSDLEIIAIEVQGLNTKQLKEFKERKGINYRLAVGSKNRSIVNYIASKARWQGSIPFFIAFNQEGEVKAIHTGALNEKELNIIYKN